MNSSSLLRDLRHACRTFRKKPGFASLSFFPCSRHRAECCIEQRSFPVVHWKSQGSYRAGSHKCGTACCNNRCCVDSCSPCSLDRTCKRAASGLALSPGQGDQRLSSFLHVVDRSLESETHFFARSEHIKAFRIDPDHLRRLATGIVLQGVAVVIVHVLNDLRFLSRGKWILRHEFAGFNPVDLAKPTNESNSYKFQPEESEVVGLVILARRWMVAKISSMSVGFVIAHRQGIGEKSDAAPRLHVVGVCVVIDHCQRDS